MSSATTRWPEPPAWSCAVAHERASRPGTAGCWFATGARRLVAPIGTTGFRERRRAPPSLTSARPPHRRLFRSEAGVGLPWRDGEPPALPRVAPDRLRRARALDRR